MTEAEWLACPNPLTMLKFLRSRASERKLFLFACACCRRVWHLLTNRQSRWAVEVVERYADAETEDEDLRLAHLGSDNVAEALIRSAATATQQAQASAAFAVANVLWGVHEGGKMAAVHTLANVGSAAYHAATAANAPSAAKARDAEYAGQTCLLRDIFGNPIHVLAVAPSWLRWQDAAVVRLAQAAYDNRILPAGTLDNARLAILADALEEAGCSDEQILRHLRGGEHYRGCWVIDLLLGKE